ncbi:TLD domain-containing protein 1 [Nosema granulosis]|uniref:Oxidation resistance protein 1 n=1 Tax=Nosema granulosis TaxID=83296 RepID=A0A9P6GY30_9MICR|nr:TLD domain-containing protein 1 [Nosema granulosis]
MLPDLKTHKIKLICAEGDYKQTILTRDIVYQIRKALDLRYKYSPVWRLMFSTYINGYSYSTMLSTFTSTVGRGPYLLIAQVLNKYYGVYFEEPLEVSLQPFGMRKKFLFKIENGNIKVTNLDPVLDQIVCSEEYLSFGYNKGGYKFLIDKSLMKIEVEEVETVEYLEIYSIEE